jgi:hypothetical protein
VNHWLLYFATGLLKLSPDKLAVVYDFISYLLERDLRQILIKTASESFQTMLASEDVLRRDWELPEEDEAWADL